MSQSRVFVYIPSCFVYGLVCFVFRLSTESNCRDAVRCVQNDFRGGHNLAAIRCPTGLVFDLDGQTCNWAGQVRPFFRPNKSCNLKLFLISLRERKPCKIVKLRPGGES